MKPSLHQRATLRHELRMNPRLYQAMDLLYMPLLDLEMHLKTELLANPFLEMVEDEDELPAETTAEEQQEKEKEEKEKEDEIDWEEILLDGFQVGGARQEYEDREVHERVTVATKDLAGHLHDQLDLSDMDPRDQILADEFIGNIGEDGYLQAPLTEIVDGANHTLAALLAGMGGTNGQAPGALTETAAETAAALTAATAPSEVIEPTTAGAMLPVEWIGAEIPASGKVIGEDEAHVVAHANAAPAMMAEPAGLGMDVPVLDPYADLHEEEDEGPILELDGVAIPWYTMADAERILRRIQELDPAGIGARDLRECLLLQLRDDGYQNSLTYKLVDDAFDDLISHRWSDLAKRYGLEPRAVQDAADVLAKFDPKPGLRFQVGDDGYVTPDLIMEKIDGDFRVFLNDSGMPRLRISRVYQELAGDKKKFQGENKEFITNKLNSATWLIQAIEQRRQTMLKVMNFIADRQRDFFEKGVEHLHPLTLREVADVISMHESTVSRVTNQKYVQTPRGVLPLKFFFSSSLGTASGEDASARSVKAQIQKLVDDENAHKPLTDSDLVKALQGRGIKIARRTVAKYRDQLGILPARMRKRV